MRPIIIALTGLLGACLISGCYETPHADEGGETTRPQVLVAKTTQLVGAFKLESGTLVATDPSYDLETARDPGLGAIITSCQTGLWNVQIVRKRFEGVDYAIPSELIFTHSGYQESDVTVWRPFQKGLGVDSGQAGAWDITKFQDQSVVPDDVRKRARAEFKLNPGITFDPWYQWCCELTRKEPGCGVMPYGAVSTSGYGDGGYPVFVCVDEYQKVIAVRIQFIDDQGRG